VKIFQQGKNTSLIKLEIDNGDEDESNTIENKLLVQSLITLLQRNVNDAPLILKSRTPSKFRRKTRTEIKNDDLDKV
jgi:hypothetical protein